MALTEQEQQERRSAMREIMLATPYIAGHDGRLVATGSLVYRIV